MPSKTVTAQARPDCMPVAGQRPGPRFFTILIVAGLVVVGAGLRSASGRRSSSDWHPRSS
jgi:hypothetical protein